MSDEEQPPKKSKITTETNTLQAVVAEQNCAHWVKRKKRYCKMTVGKGKLYCGEHEVDVTKDSNQDSALNSDRIYCPLDGRHTIYRKNLNKHLKICNARPSQDNPEYIQKNINVGNKDEDEQPQNILETIILKDLDDEEFFKIIDKVKVLYKTFIENKIETFECQHTCMNEELANETYGKETRKHLIQNSALLGILENEEQIKNSTSFIEFGAGKGQLAVHLASLLEAKQDSQVILVDRMSLRHKKDNKVDRALVQRIRADIADFCLDKLDTLKTSQHCVAISKHLCGGATDLTLRCIVQASIKLTNFIMIALCCHHRCDWQSFVGKDFLRKHEISTREFVIMTKMVGWAVCGTGLSRERRKALEDQKLTAQEIEEINANQRLSLVEREAIGFMCKRVLDHARLEYLRQHHYDAKLYYYVSKEVTLENVVLLARKKANDPDNKISMT